MSTINFHYRYALVLLLMPVGISAFSQRLTIWKGGTPGMKNAWNCARNWSTGHVPDEFSDVVIRDVSTSTFAAPVIRSGTVEIHTLKIQNNGSVTLGKDAVMLVSGEIIEAGVGSITGEGKILSMEGRQLDAKGFVEGNTARLHRNGTLEGSARDF